MIPFINSNNKCVKRGEVKDHMYKGVEISIDLINKATEKVSGFGKKIKNGMSSLWSMVKGNKDSKPEIVEIEEGVQEFLNEDSYETSVYRLGKSEDQIGQSKKKLITDLKYHYDDEIGMGMTRYELGLWLITIGFFFLRKYADSCGDRKTVFDFMHAKNQGKGVSLKNDNIKNVEPQDSLYIKNEKGELQQLTMSQVRQIREQLLRTKEGDKKKQ
eukprot:403342334